MLVLACAVLHRNDFICGVCTTSMIILCANMTSGISCTRNRGHRRRRTRSRGRTRSQTLSRNRSRTRTMTTRMCLIVMVTKNIGIVTYDRPNTCNCIDGRVIIRVAILMVRYIAHSSAHWFVVPKCSPITNMQPSIRDRTIAIEWQSYYGDSSYYSYEYS